MTATFAAVGALALFTLALLAFLVGGAEDRLAATLALAGLVALALAMVVHVSPPPPGDRGEQAT